MKTENPLKAWRAKARVTQTGAAAKLGVSVQSIRQWEWGGMDPSEANLERIAALMETTVKALDKAWKAWKGGLTS